MSEQERINQEFAREVYEHQLEKARAERDLAIAALRLYRYALMGAANVLRARLEEERPIEPIEEASRLRIESAPAAADGILGSLEP
jgi:hypothetical protein